jgi:hypothetical protein
MKPATPLSKSEMIERSILCLKWGLWGMLPVIGIPMAIVALQHYGRVKRGKGALWNPAQRYLFWGALCARAGLWPILILFVLFSLAVIGQDRGWWH